MQQVLDRNGEPAGIHAEAQTIRHIHSDAQRLAVDQQLQAIDGCAYEIGELDFDALR